ncbi:hypothetical protein QFC24_006223 [Naganishia onofrii]|uniref:Uncharacterized protein n=1 Tax=Naganishia onofrii TaxID=1851511 RepID=A0ACC2X4X3_9TREE|nr:hypothetical protein QFC24_006223 [Naganishia onofrii]
MSSLNRARQSPDGQLILQLERDDEEKQRYSQDAERTVVEEETILGPTQTYQPSPHLLRTPLKSATTKAAPTPPNKPLNLETPSPEPYHVLTDVPMGDSEDEEYEPEKLMWETWRQNDLIRVKHKLKKLEWEKLALAAERAGGALQKYSNQEPLGGPRLSLENQMIGREIKRKFAEISTQGMVHPSLTVEKATCSSKSKRL